MEASYLFTSESVAEGHPDKVADCISDTILDACLHQDPGAKVACETLVTKDLVVLAGELHTTAAIDAASIARRVIRDIGYTDPRDGFCHESDVEVRLHTQSPDIRRGVDRADGIIGAGDQGMMFGYACDETAELMPLPIMLAHRLVRRLRELRVSGELPWLKPDAKSQVSVRYRDGRPVAVESVVLSTQHTVDAGIGEIRAAVIERVIRHVIPEELRAAAMTCHVNPTGRFVEGGPVADTGLTGRKIIVDTYGGACPHGGGAFSGKDPTKVDRSAAYAARYVAKNLVAAGIARRCTIQLAYAIGCAEPVSVMVDFHGTGVIPGEKAEGIIRGIFDLTPAGIIRMLDLRRPIYEPTAAYGHFGREGMPWERVDQVDAIRAAI
jgi:S-adenosylmethionine synthetase